MTPAEEYANALDVKTIGVPDLHLTDADIVRSVREGNLNSYGSLMRRHNQRMYRIARSIVIDDDAAMDVVQEAYIKAFARIAEFRGPDSFCAWLASITRNEALMHLRRKKTIKIIPEKELPSGATESRAAQHINAPALPDASVANDQLREMLEKNIDRLPEDFRVVFVLRAVELLTVRETANLLDIKEETVKTRHFRAKSLLREYIQEYLDAAGLSIYEFGHARCDAVLINVLTRLRRQK